jgi:hypothetical protein
LKDRDPRPTPPVEPVYQRNSRRFHLIMACCTVGLWAITVRWWYAPMVDRSNDRKRAGYQRDLADYERARWEWQQRHVLPPAPADPFMTGFFDPRQDRVRGA